MTKDTTKAAAVAADIMLLDNWFDPIEDGVRERARGFIETMLEEELDGVLCRPRYGRRKTNGNEEAAAPLVGCRHGHRKRALMGTFGKTEIAVPRARIMSEDGKTREWKSQSLPAYQRRTKAADALIAGAYLAGTNTRRVRRALKAVFAGEVGKDVVSRTWRKIPWGIDSDQRSGRVRSLRHSPYGGNHDNWSSQRPSTGQYTHRSSCDFRFIGIKPIDLADHIALARSWK